jgi:hypothetical protein
VTKEIFDIFVEGCGKLDRGAAFQASDNERIVLFQVIVVKGVEHSTAPAEVGVEDTVVSAAEPREATFDTEVAFGFDPVVENGRLRVEKMGSYWCFSPMNGVAEAEAGIVNVVHRSSANLALGLAVTTVGAFEDDEFTLRH